MGNVDWDAVWNAAGAIMYGPGTRILIAGVCGYMFIHGFSHERPYQALCGIIGAVGYFGSGALLGRIGIH
jgi:hypothetical protein